MNHTGNNFTLVCYDIANDKLRRKIDKTMQDFGIRLQFSIFLCYFDPKSLSCCRDKLRQVLQRYQAEKEPRDSLIIFARLHPESADCLLGSGKVEWERPSFKIF